MSYWGNYHRDVIDRIDNFVLQAELMPGVVVIHEVGDYPVIFMSKKGLKLLGVTLKELQQLKAEYHSRFFNIEDMGDFIPKLHDLLLSNDAEANFTYFQQVKFANLDSWVWHLTCTRVFAYDQNNKPLLIVSVAIPVQDMKHITNKAERLQKENLFLKKYVHRFASLGAREKEVLKWVSLSLSSHEIAQKMFISVETVQTHRKNIKRKLEISTTYEFMEYARAFDLI